MTKQVDRAWFLEKLKETNKSVRGLGRHIGIDASAVTRTLKGERRMKAEEVEPTAEYLGVPQSEVRLRVGWGADVGATATNAVFLVAVIDENGAIKRLAEPQPLPQAVLRRAHACTAGVDGLVLAAQIRATEGALSLWDDAIVLFVDVDEVDNSAIGSLAICRNKDGAESMARIISARKTGEAVIASATGKKRESKISAAMAILAVIP